jgi:23S rRNA G2069 N7-methylase RlmK/C1962 C5-methylase RlmI
VRVDSSQDAIDTAQDNVALNNVDSSHIEFVKADIQHYMQKALDKERNLI